MGRRGKRKRAAPPGPHSWGWRTNFVVAEEDLLSREGRDRGPAGALRNP